MTGPARRRFSILVVAVLAATAALAAGCSDDDNPPQGLAVFAFPDEGDAPLEVSFTARTESNEEGLTYVWDFGDGTTGTGQEPTHTYTEPREYTVSVTATNEAERQASDTATVRVTGEAAPTQEPTPEEEATPEEEPTVEEEAGAGDFDAWVAAVNAACEATTEAAAQVEGEPNDPEVLAQFVAINEAETEAIAAAGVPEERSDEAQAWIDLRNEGSETFISLVDDPPTAPGDPREAALREISIELDALSADLGLESCRAQ